MIDAILLAIVASTPLLLAVEGELLVQRAGIINLGIEGVMLTAALTSVIGAHITGSITAGVVSGILGGAIATAIFGWFAIHRGADQIVTGTAINLLALGATGFIAREMQLESAPTLNNNAIVAFAWILLPPVIAAVLWRTRFGLLIRACGENPEAVTANGASVAMHRWSALGIEAVLVGLGGAHLALALSSGFAENMTAGRGFIALSIVIFGRWKVKGAILGTAVFGIAAAAQYALQANGHGLPFHLLLATPYVLTLLILCGIAGRVRPPEALGK